MSNFSDMQQLFEQLKKEFKPNYNEKDDNKNNYYLFKNFGIRKQFASLSNEHQEQLKYVMQKAGEYASNKNIEFTTPVENAEWLMFYSCPNGSFGIAQKFRAYIPIAEDVPHDKVVSRVLSCLMKEGVAFTGKYAKKYRSDSFMVEVDNESDLKLITDLFRDDKSLKTHLGKLNPFIPQKDGLGIIELNHNVTYTQGIAEIFQNYLTAEQKNGTMKSATLDKLIQYANTNGPQLTNERGILKQLIGCIETEQSKEVSNQQKKTLPDPKLYPQYDFSFEGLKKTYDSYDLQRKEENGKEAWVAIDKKTKAVVTDSLTIDRTKFARQWVGSFINSGLSMPSIGNDTTNIEYINQNYAWNENAKNDYNNLMGTMQMQLRGTGNVSPKEASEFLQSCKQPGVHQTNFKHLFSSVKYSEATTNYFRYATPDAQPQTKPTPMLTASGQEKLA